MGWALQREVEFEKAKSIQDFIDTGLDEKIISTHFEDKTYNQNLTPKMFSELEDAGVEDLFDFDQNGVIWFKNPGGIPGNVSSRLPKFLLIPDRTKSEELSGKSGALMETLKSLFEDVRDDSYNFKYAQYYLGVYKVNACEKRIAYQDPVERDPIGGKFGEGIRKYSLGRICARLQKTSETVISLQFLVTNLEKILRGSFLFFSSLVP